MAGKADILAGSAFVRLFLRDDMSTKLKTSLKAVGTAGAAAAASLSAAAGESLRRFVDFGSTISDISARTGASVQTLQTYKFAAEQVGASMEDVEQAMRGAARQGKTFEQTASEIAKIEDPTLRAKAAMEGFGKSGTKLIEMISSFKSLKASSAALGPLLTAEDVALADQLGDQMAMLGEAMNRAMMQIGAALGPMLKSALDTALGMVVRINELVSEANEFGRGGDWLDKYAEFMRTPWAEFKNRGGAVAATGGGQNRGGLMAQEAEAADKLNQKITTADEINRSINRGIEHRNALIRESWTEAERFRAKEQEIIQAINAANRNRVLGFVGEQDAQQQMMGLKIALTRVRAAEAERLAALAQKPEVAKAKLAEAKMLEKRSFASTQATSAFGAMALGFGGGGTKWDKVADVLQKWVDQNRLTERQADKRWERLIAAAERKRGFG